jgi:ubiquinone/menaquinone biosynthesis C-methylase UbiE
LRQLLLDRLPAGARCLDVGGGTGATGAWLADCGSVVAADLEPLALSLYRERHRAAAVACDAGALPFANESFDAVLCVTVLYHRAVTAPAEVVAEMARVVRPGGIVCLWEPGVRRLRRAHDRVTHSGRRFSRHDLAEFLSRAGMSIERSTGAYSFLIPPAVVKAVIERGDVASDLDRNADGLHGTLAAVAAIERRLLRRCDLPVGLSVVALARR